MGRESQPAGLLTTAVVVHPGTRHVAQTVPVEVRVGQLTQGLVVVWVTVSVLVTVTEVVWTETEVSVLVAVDVLVSVSVTGQVVHVAPRQIVVGWRVTWAAAPLHGRVLVRILLG